MKIRPSRTEDFEEVFPLLQQLWPDRSMDKKRLKQVFVHCIACDDQAFLSAVTGERVIGFCSLSIRDSIWQAGKLGHVDELVIDQNHRGQSIGSLLLDRAACIAKEQGCHRVELDSAHHRKRAHSFYQERGFENRAYLFSKRL